MLLDKSSNLKKELEDDKEAEKGKKGTQADLMTD